MKEHRHSPLKRKRRAGEVICKEKREPMLAPRILPSLYL